MGGRKKKKKRSERKRHQRPQVRVPPGTPEGMTIVRPSPGQEKMSEVLLDFVEPYSEQWETAEELRKLLTLAVIAWNAALRHRFPNVSFGDDNLLGPAQQALRALQKVVSQQPYGASGKQLVLLIRNFEPTSYDHEEFSSFIRAV